MPILPDHNALGIPSEQTIGIVCHTGTQLLEMTGSTIDNYYLNSHAFQIMSYSCSK